MIKSLYCLGTVHILYLKKEHNLIVCLVAKIIAYILNTVHIKLLYLVELFLVKCSMQLLTIETLS